MTIADTYPQASIKPNTKVLPATEYPGKMARQALNTPILSHNDETMGDIKADLESAIANIRNDKSINTFAHYFVETFCEHPGKANNTLGDIHKKHLYTNLWTKAIWSFPLKQRPNALHSIQDSICFKIFGYDPIEEEAAKREEIIQYRSMARGAVNEMLAFETIKSFTGRYKPLQKIRQSTAEEDIKKGFDLVITLEIMDENSNPIEVEFLVDIKSQKPFEKIKNNKGAVVRSLNETWDSMLVVKTNREGQPILVVNIDKLGFPNGRNTNQFELPEKENFFSGVVHGCWAMRSTLALEKKKRI